jgi:hypothetical protein
MTDRKPEQSADGRCSQVYLLRLWREAAGAPWRLSLREASGGQAIGFADLDNLVIFLLRVMEGKQEATQDEQQQTSWIG